MNVKRLRQLADRLYSKKASLDSLWQEIADNFYPERASFTSTRSLGADFASNLISSYPILCRRDLQNQFGTMLRPTARPWFHTRLKYQDKVDNDTRMWLQAFEEAQRRAMYDPRSLFTKAKSQSDGDVATFGQAATSIELNKNADGLLYRTWHLRDMAWQENEEGVIGCIFRKWKAPALVLHRIFGDRVHETIKRALEKEPFKEFNYLHMVVEADMYDQKTTYPYYSIWYDCDHDVPVEEHPTWTKIYVIPRWQTVSDSQYSYPPAAVAALPDARLVQAMSWTILEAGERATYPPMIATIDAVKSDIGNYAGGTTWVDPDYDERLGDALRPVSQDFRGFQFGADLLNDARQMLYRAFYLDSLTMPQRGPEMTAYEVSQRVQQYIRDALPLFEPLEAEDNAVTCEMTFELMMRAGAFGSPLSWPRALQGQEISFHFESPLHDAIEEQKGQKFLQSGQLISAAMQLDPTVVDIPDAHAALRDALAGIGIPANWTRSESEVKQLQDKREQQQQAAQLLAAAEGAGRAARDFGKAQESAANAGIV